MEKSKIDIIIVKKEIGGLISAYKMNQKIFILSDFIKKYPFLDINNKEYFEIKTVELLPYGTKVKYQGETYHIIKVVGFKQFCADLIYGNDVVPVYGLSKSKYGKLEKEAVGIDVKLSETYWFINSSGKICSSEVGKDARADRWRKRVGNYFETEEECRKMYMKLTEPDSEVKINIEIVYTK